MDIRIAVTDEEKEAIYRSRSARSTDADEIAARRLVDPEDENSWLIYLVGVDGELTASARVTRGSDGFSLRQVASFELEPLLAELSPGALAVVERVVVTTDEQRGDVARALFAGTPVIPGWDGVVVGIGACPGLLVTDGLPLGWEHRASTAGGPAQGDVVQLICFPRGSDGLPTACLRTR